MSIIELKHNTGLAGDLEPAFSNYLYIDKS